MILGVDISTCEACSQGSRLRNDGYLDMGCSGNIDPGLFYEAGFRARLWKGQIRSSLLPISLSPTPKGALFSVDSTSGLMIVD